MSKSVSDGYRVLHSHISIILLVQVPLHFYLFLNYLFNAEAFQQGCRRGRPSQELFQDLGLVPTPAILEYLTPEPVPRRGAGRVRGEIGLEYLLAKYIRTEEEK